MYQDFEHPSTPPGQEKRTLHSYPPTNESRLGRFIKHRKPKNALGLGGIPLFLLLFASLFFSRANGQIIKTVAGNHTLSISGDGGAALLAGIGTPNSIACDAIGNYYISSQSSYSIRKVNATGIITTIAGAGAGFSGMGGPAISAEFGLVNGIALDAAGNIYFTSGDERVYKINTSGIITVFAGTGVAGYDGNGGDATNAKIHNPQGIAVDGAGNVYIAEFSNNVVRKINTSGIISVFAGNGSSGYGGDGGDATLAQLWYPMGICLDATGNFYIADYHNGVVRKVNMAGIISSLPSAYGLHPVGVAAEASGNIYIATELNHDIKVISGSTISTYAGNSISGYSGDGGPAILGKMTDPFGVACDGSGNLYISDMANHYIRKVIASQPICVGSTFNLGSGTTGTWASSNTAVATVSSTGVVTGVSAGTTTITTTVGSTPAYVTVTVLPAVASITGTPIVCDLLGTTTLYHATAGGAWSSSNTAVATIDPASGLVSGVSFGSTTITYTLSTGCYATTEVDVDPKPDNIGFSGTYNQICNLSGGTINLTETTAGGTWSIDALYSTLSGTTGPSVTVTSGSIAESLFVHYTLITGCKNSLRVFVGPPAITGPSIICGHPTTIALSDAWLYGTWSSSNTSIATVSSTGVVTSVGLGITDISYTFLGCSSIYSVTVDPGAPPITGNTTLCPPTYSVYLSDLMAGGNWSSSNTGVATIGATSGFVTGVSGGATIISYTLPTTGCTATTTVTNAAIFGPSTFDVCVGGQITLYDALPGGTWSSSSSAVASFASPSLGVLDGNSPGVIHVFYNPPTFAACGTISALVTVNALPTVDTVSGGGSICNGGTGLNINLSNSTTGVSYQAKYGGTAIGSAVAGTGSPLSFGPYTGAGTYTIEATDNTTGCTSTMTGSATIIVNPLPTPYLLTGGGSYCAGGLGQSIMLGNSTTGVNYQVYVSGTAIGSSIAGTGAAINFGPYSGAGTYTIEATDAVTSCTSTMIGSPTISVNPLPSIYIVSGGGTFCTGGAGVPIGISGSSTGVNYQAYSGGLPIGSIVPGTGGAMSLGLYSTAGTYTIIASDAVSGCTQTMAGSATVTVNPAPSIYPLTGGGSYCSGGVGLLINLSGSTIGNTYQIYYAGSALGSAVTGTGSSLNFGPYTGAGVYNIVATDVATGCTADMAGTPSIIINPLPTNYTLSGSGTTCAGGAGISIHLSGSDLGASYQLKRGSIVVVAAAPGTGSGLTFGPYSIAGVYTAEATNLTTGCTTSMSGSATISTTPAPTVYTVSGGGSFCSGGAGVTINLNNSETGVNYELWTGVLATGIILPGSTGIGLNFPGIMTTGIYTIKASNTSTHCISTMSGSASVINNPLPNIYTISGGGPICSGGTGALIHLSGSDLGTSYELKRGSVVVVSAAPGTGAGLTFGPYTTGGTYTSVATNVATGCISSMSSSATVTVNPAPTVYPVTGGGSYCSGGTGVTVGLSNSTIGINYKVMYLGSVLASASGTGSALSFGPFTGAGAYTIIATNATTGCSSTMSGSASISILPLPSTYSVTGSGSYCSGGTGVSVGLSNSTIGVNYQAWYAGAAVGSAVTGTGSSLSFGPFTGAGAYTIVATDPSTGCSTTMTGSATITINPLPTIYSVTSTGSYCAGGSGATISLSSSTTGISYQLLVDGAASGTPLTGTGGALTFGTYSVAGVYTIVATNTTTGCTATMTGSVTIGVPFSSFGVDEISPLAISGDAAYTYCASGGSFTLRVHTVPAMPPGTMYTWTSSGSVTTLATPDFTPSVGGAPVTYTVSVSTSCGVFSTGVTVVPPNAGCSPCTYYNVNALRASRGLAAIPGCTTCGQTQVFHTIVASTLDATNIVDNANYYIVNNATLGKSTYTGDNFLMAQNIALNVTAATPVTIDKCHFFSGCDWYGINVPVTSSSAGHLNVTSSLFEGASGTYGIMPNAINVIATGSYYTSGMSDIVNTRGSIYNNNLGGIQVKNYSPTYSSTINKYPFSFVHNVFCDRDFINTPYTSSTSPTDYYPFTWPTVAALETFTTSPTLPTFGIDAYPTTYLRDHGILIENVGSNTITTPGTGLTPDAYAYNGVLIGDTAADPSFDSTNLFDYISRGVVVHSSNAKFSNNTFKNLALEGLIYVNTSYNHINKVEINGTSTSSTDNTNNRFYQCPQYAVHCEDGNPRDFVCQYATFTRDATITGSEAIYLLINGDQSHSDYDIHDNYIYNHADGIHISYLGLHYYYYVLNGSTHIYNNVIKGKTGASYAESLLRGITYIDGRVYYVVGAGINGSVTINDNTITGAQSGIYVNGENEYTSVYNNTITMANYGGVTGRIGLNAVHSPFLSVQNNEVSGYGYSCVPATDGININTSGRIGDTADVSCNSSHDVTSGFSFSGVNILTWKDNQMVRNTYGLHIYGASSIGTQGTSTNPCDNHWDEPAGRASGCSGWPTSGWGDASVHQTYMEYGAGPSSSPLYVRSVTGTYHPTNNGCAIGSLAYAYGTGGTLLIGYKSTYPTCANMSFRPANPTAATITEMEGGYTLYPNPNAGEFVIQTDLISAEPVNVVVYNMLGQKVYDGVLQFENGKSPIKLNNPTPGIYQVKLTDGAGQEWNQRVVIESNK